MAEFFKTDKPKPDTFQDVFNTPRLNKIQEGTTFEQQLQGGPTAVEQAKFFNSFNPTEKELGLEDETRGRIESFKQKFEPTFLNAIKTAENDEARFGVRSEDVSSPEEANQVLKNSLSKAFDRWMLSGRQMPFIDFFASRWAPIGAKNDPEGLNKNFPKNFRESIRQQLDPESLELLRQNGVL